MHLINQDRELGRLVISHLRLRLLFISRADRFVRLLSERERVTC